MKVNLAGKSLPARFQFLFRLAVGLMLLLPVLAVGQNSVQVNTNNFTGNTNVVAVPFPGSQGAGNLNVVVVGWNDTSATIASVADSNGNTYAPAAGTVSTAVPAPGAPSQAGVSQAIYYAKNIVAGTNTVTVTFNQNTAAQSVRIVEYSGLDAANPLDTSAGGSGSVSPADSGAATTNSANDLIVGAGTTTNAFTGPGAGFVTRSLNGFGDIVEDETVTATGSINATATLTAGSWVMQMIAFRVAAQTPPTLLAPAITSLSVGTAPEAGGTPLIITGSNFEPGATVLFSGGAFTASGVNCTVTLLVSPNSTIACLTPSFPALVAGITVTNVDGQTAASSPFTFTASTPFSTAVAPSITPVTGPTNGGTAVVISGSDFAAGAKVTVAGVPADKVSIPNVNTILANVPAGSAGARDVVVTNPSATPGTLTGAYAYAPGGGINFVQANSAQPTSPATTATIPYLIAQTAGNLNVVVVGWADTVTTVLSVTDIAGNTYTPALSPTVGTGLSQTIYYAKNIHAAANNTVTITFSAPAQSPDIQALEYSGLDSVNPLDAAGGSAGTAFLADSGPITTTNSSDLVIGAATVSGRVTAAGSGFTTVGITPLGDNVEHLLSPPAGVIDAVAAQNVNQPWVMQAVAFQLSGTVPDFNVTVSPPTTASVTPAASASYTISVSGLNGFSSAVALTCPTGLPSGASCSFVPPSVNPGGAPVTSTLTIATTASTPTGNSAVTVAGTSGSLNHNATLSLAVQDFNISASALSPATATVGGSATSTVTITATNGFSGNVNLSCSNISPAGTPAPTCAFVPNPVTGGAGTSTLTVSTIAASGGSAGTPLGNYVFTISGTSGSLTHTQTVGLAVQAAPPSDFQISASALAPAAVSAGGSATSTVSIAPLNGLSTAVDLTCSIAPPVTPAPTCALSPTSLANGSGASTLTVSTTAATTASVAPQLKGIFSAMWLPIGGLALIGAGFRSRKQKILSLLFGCVLFSGLIFLAACGGGGGSSRGGGGHPGTPSGAYTVTITATSGSLTHTATASLAVH